jgi:hypothetical protein
VSDFDFIKGFAGVDLLMVEAIGKVVGRAVGVAFEGMIEVGVSEQNAHRIIRSVVAELSRSLLTSRPPA